MRKLTRFFSVVVALITAFGLVACATDYPDGSSSIGGTTDKITVAFDRETLTMDEWDTERISVSASDNSAVNVTAADNSILYIRGSNVTALKAGTTTLTAVAVKDKTATATMTVVVNAKPENKPVLTVSGPESLAIGASGKFVASLGKVDAADYSVEWSVSDTSKARVDANGNVTAIAAGRVDVNAAVKYRSVDFTAKASLEINREITVVFGSDEETAKFDLSDIAEVSGEYTLTLNGKTYTADSDGNITLAKADFDTTDGNKFDGTLVCGANIYAFKLVVYMAGDAMAYQDGQLMTPDANGHFTVDKTAAADENGLRWITFDSAESMLEKGYELLTLKIKFNAFSTANAGIIDDTISDYNYNFGYKYTEPETNELVWLFWDNNYQGQAYGGAMKPDHHAPYGYGYIKIYDTAGNLILDYYKKQINDASGTHGNWSDYVNPLQTNTEYVFVLDISKTGDIAFSGLDDAVITEIKWGKKDETVLTFAKTATIDEWQPLELNATVNDDSEIVYELIDSDGVLYLDGNKVVGLKAGTAKVKATANGKTAQMTVTVNENEANRPVLTVTGDDTVDVYQSTTLTATLKCGSTEIASSAYALTYSATGDFLSINNGVIVGLKAGETTITATAVYCGKTFTVTHAVTVTDTTTPVDPSVGKLYQGGTLLTASDDGNYTMRADIDDKTLTFDAANAKIALGYTKLRVSVKFSDLTDNRISMNNYSFAFGYYYKNVKVGWYNSYNHRDDLFGAYVGAFEGDNTSPLAYGYLRVYNADGEKIFEHYEVDDWSSNPNGAYGYIDPLAVNTVYIFEFDVAKTSDITLVGFENATFTEIEWVNPASATVTFEESEKTVDEWTEFTVKATASDGSDVVYGTENTDVIAISGNKVIGLKAGTATITATANGKTAQMSVTVTENAEKRPVLTVTLDDEVEIGDELTPVVSFKANGADVATSAYTLTAVSADQEIAAISGAKVIGVSAGEVKITFTATYYGVEFKKECMLTVKQAEVPVDHSVGKLYQGGTLLTADKDGNYTLSADISDKTLTFDDAETKIALGYTKLRVSVKFSVLNDRRIPINGDSYDFGYYYKTVKVGWYNSYSTSGAYVGAFEGDNTSPLAYGYLRVYNADGEKIFEHYEFSGWSSSGYGYITPLAVNTVYVFEFDIAKTKDITLVGFENATFTKIEWVDTVNVSVAFEESEKTIDEWTEFTVKAIVNDWSANVVCATENTDVIAISGNKVIGLKAGTATITATANGKTAQMSVTVTENAEKRPALAATLKDEIEIAESVGVTATLTSGTTVIESADYVLSIVSANEAIAKVQSGSVVGVAAGTVKITVTATYYGIEFEKEIVITVKVAEDPTVGKLYQGGTQLTADENGVYRVNTTVSGDSEGKRWLTVDSAKASVYPYMRFKVKFNSFVSTSKLVGYDYHFGFNYGTVRFFWCNNYAGGGFGGALDTSNSATQNHYFNIYTASNNAKVLNAMTTSGWTSYYTLSENVEYVFEFNVGAMGSGFTFCGFDDAEISDVTWAETILA